MPPRSHHPYLTELLHPIGEMIFLAHPFCNGYNSFHLIVGIVVYVNYSCWVMEWVREYVILARISDGVMQDRAIVAYGCS